MNWQYTLKNKPKLVCPNCGHKEFNGLIDTTTGEYVDKDKYGMCDRIIKCGYKCFPDKSEYRQESLTRIYAPPKKRYHMSEDVLSRLKQNPLEDNFSVGLRALFPNADQILKKYEVVCGHESGKYKTYTGFPYRDLQGRLLSVKMMVYNPDLHRAKDSEDKGIVSWLHYLDGYKVGANEEFIQSFFGEHLIRQNDYDCIGILESEKSAIVASCCFPDVLWLACGSVVNIRATALKGIYDKKVIFYPDADGWDKWKAHFDEINRGKWAISELPKQWNGKEDIADRLIAERRAIL